MIVDLPPPADPNESTPLLNNPDCEFGQDPNKPVEPFPTAQLTALCVTRAADPIAYTQIFPYINEWIWRLGTTADISRIGIYSGLVEAIFAVAQCLTGYWWAALSDTIGRRPVILLGSGGLAVLTLLLGLCTSFKQIMFIRAAGGLLAGNVATYQSILAEITPTVHQHIAYPLYASIWPLGAILGPLMGAQLSNLGTKYPTYFTSNFVLKYPYFAPNAFCTILTLPSKREGYVAPVNTPPPTYGVKDLLALRKIRAITASSFLLAFLGTAFDIGFVLFCYTPVERGGLAFSVDEIGYALALSGALMICAQLFLMPTLLRRMKPHHLYNVCMRMWPLAFFLIPFLNLIVRAGVDVFAIETTVWLWVGITVMLICSRLAALAFATNLILVRDSCPSPACLGAVNGLVTVAMNGSRCFSPAFISSVFAFSLDCDLLGWFPVWVVVMIGVCGIGCYFSEQMVRFNEEDERLGQVPAMQQAENDERTAGILAGNAATYQSVLAEITPVAHQHIAYPFYTSVWPLGATLGPLIGAQLSNIGTKYPTYFRASFFRKYPYFAPNAFCTVLVFAGFALAYLFLEETLPSKRKGYVAPLGTPPPTYGVKDLLAIRRIRAIAASSFLLAFIGTAFSVGFVLFCYAPVTSGGLGFTVDEIGYALALGAMLMISLQLLVMPPLLRRIKPHQLYNHCMRIWPIVFFLVPFLNLIARAETDVFGTEAARTAWLWVGITSVQICARLAMLTNATNLILVRDSCPNPASLGTLNGVINIVQNASRCVSPAFISAIVAFSMNNNLLGWFPVWSVVMIAISVVSCYYAEQMVWFTEEEERQGRVPALQQAALEDGSAPKSQAKTQTPST
ncbi:MFS domain-containing protein [Mycena kentingensis (nom. inval.)]|nr:MFS domain-containing protein [Mycena kentingensis (nom. inval.)]